jgi:hypothetical protein
MIMMPDEIINFYNWNMNRLVAGWICNIDHIQFLFTVAAWIDLLVYAKSSI